MTCSTCKGASYAGCGMHVEQVLAGVPQSQRCTCASAKQGSGSAAPEQRGWRRIFGRG
ncbi:hypothetical protein [Streptacidiphilus albus]|uniref:hypothetical protein n=1 Tax=Streptacidiphilus albus TaxID=105425 RepID=UPI0018CD4E6E|nr:hypothetical protein [Streptacidiphilus albus]